LSARCSCGSFDSLGKLDWFIQSSSNRLKLGSAGSLCPSPGLDAVVAHLEEEILQILSSTQATAVRTTGNSKRRQLTRDLTAGALT
jgi:hypothetical protein